MNIFSHVLRPRPMMRSASASSSLAASNTRCATGLPARSGPMVKYRSGPKAGQLVAPDIESWFRQDRFQGAPHIVAQWADLHNALARTWVKADPLHGAYVDDWAKSHPALVAQFIKDNPAHPPAEG